MTGSCQLKETDDEQQLQRVTIRRTVAQGEKETQRRDKRKATVDDDEREQERGRGREMKENVQRSRRGGRRGRREE